MTPIERAARALCEIDGIDPNQKYRGDSSVGHEPFDYHWRAYQPRARAVISAIREPSEGMRDAAYTVEAEFRTTMGNLDRGYSEGDGIWQAMIDALLAEGKY
jgi:hypothetical protein